MSQERTEAVVLRGVDFSESSRVVTFLTPGRGRVACLARGARRGNSPLAAALDTFNRVELVLYWKDSRSVQSLGDVTVLDGYRAIKSDLAKGAYAAFPLEIAYRAARENEPSAGLYAALTGGFEAMAAWQGDPRAHACWQALRLLREAGIAPRFGHCIHTGAVVDGAAGFSFEGGVVAGGERADRRISARTRATLAALGEQREECPALPVDREAFTLLREFAAYQFESDLRSARVIDQLFPGHAE